MRSAAAKAGMLGMTRALAIEAGGHGITGQMLVVDGGNIIQEYKSGA